MKFLIYAWLAIQVALYSAPDLGMHSKIVDAPLLSAAHAQYLNPDPLFPSCILPESHELAIQQVFSTIPQLKPRQINPVEYYSYRKEAGFNFQESYLQLCISLLRSQDISIIVYPFNYFW